MRIVFENLKRLGKMPNQDLDNDKEDVLKKVREYETLFEKNQEPITIEEGKVLLSLLPDDKFYNLQWRILSFIEDIELTDMKIQKEYEELISMCSNEEIKSNLIAGYENWKEQK